MLMIIDQLKTLKIVALAFQTTKKLVLMVIIFSNSYKCAVFFENLTSKRPLTWIGALPDALKKAKSPEEVQDILGADVTEESFSQLTSCDASTANARCYSIVSKSVLIDYSLT